MKLIEFGKRSGYAAIDATKVEGVYVEHQQYWVDVLREGRSEYSLCGRWRVVVKTVTGNEYVAGIYGDDRGANALAKEIAKGLASS